MSGAKTRQFWEKYGDAAEAIGCLPGVPEGSNIITVDTITTIMMSEAITPVTVRVRLFEMVPSPLPGPLSFLVLMRSFRE